ncbi:hypothetical protein Tsubulata_004910 [Turnera subulata]|uniref:Pentatricopeptide repeat-containing protein n=1 Tax=Turnera subulata TaxID=218843 RepID=A0A9Q0JH70_9ROSI|nr:hypothetical protein Tsubulata_004910 [Turnera subulata]
MRQLSITSCTDAFHIFGRFPSFFVTPLTIRIHGSSRQTEPTLSRIPLFTPIRFLHSSRQFKNSYDYTQLLHLCKTTKCVQQIHSLIITGGFEQNPFVATALIGKYCGEGSGESMENARKVFDDLLEKDTFSGNTIIKGYANLGPFMEAVNVYDEMRSSIFRQETEAIHLNFGVDGRRSNMVAPSLMDSENETQTQIYQTKKIRTTQHYLASHIHREEDYVVKVSGSVGEGAPTTLPPISGKFSNPGRGPTFPFASTCTGYLRICPCNGLKS